MATGSGSAFINRAIASLFNGISQQPPALRLPSQAELQVNCYPALVDGLKKRSPTLHVAKLNTTTTTNRYVHFINRDETEQYTVIIENGDLKVYALDGTAQTVSFPSGKAYLTAADPATMFTAMTVADFTFIVNKTKVTAMGGATVTGTFTGTVQQFSGLPGSPAANAVYKVEGDNSNKFDNYYVKYNGSTAVWEEWALPGETYQINGATMPHTLVRTSPGNFTFAPVTWTNRLVGDTALVPNPSFIGQTINDIFLHRNRLGLLSGENTILSASGDFYNFYRESMITVIDSDPIDTAASNTKVAILKHAVPFDKTLLLFSDNTQFIMAGTQVLTPLTATIDVATEFAVQTSAPPVAAGPNVYFAVPKGSFTGIREYFVDSTVATNDAADVTAHVPRFVPDDIFSLVASNNEDVLFCLSHTTPNRVYVYKYYWQADEKVQSAWGYWEMDAGATIMGMTAINTDLYFVIKRADGTFLESMSIQSGTTDASMGFLVHLDRRDELTGVYDAGNDWTTWTLPYVESGDVQVILGSGWTTQAGSKLFNTSRPTTSTIRVSGDYSTYPCYVGLAYEMRYRFSEQFVRDEARNAVRAGRLMLKRLLLNFENSGFFKVEVTPDYRPTYTYPFTGQVLGTGSIVLGQVSITSGTYKVPLVADATGVTIDIVNDTHLPSIFQSAEWTGLFHSLSQRG